MNQDRFAGKLKQFSGKMQEQWGRLTNDSLREFAGQREQRAGKIQEQYGYAIEEAARQLKEFRNRNRDLWAK